MKFENIGKDIKNAFKVGTVFAAMTFSDPTDLKAMENKSHPLDNKAKTEMMDSITLPQEVEMVAEKLGFKIIVEGRNQNNGGLDIYVQCEPLEGGQGVQGVDEFASTDSTFTLIRNADMPDFYRGYVSENESDPKNIIDKTAYDFSKNSVKRIITNKDGSFREEEVLNDQKMQIIMEMGPK